MNDKPKTLYVCIMKNIFADLHCPVIFDLKGSTHNRRAKVVNGKQPSVLKDLDWLSIKMKLRLDKGLQSFITQVIESDTNFLQSINVMDYSFILGIHRIEGDPDEYLARLKRPEDQVDSYANGVKKAIHQRYRGGVVSSDKSCIYCFAIIDIYTRYSGKKKSEHFFKTLIYGSGISAVDPELYAARFRNFINAQFA